MANKMKCVFCKGKNEKIITFEDEKLIKCKEVLSVRVKFNLKYNNVQLPDEVNTSDGYHRQCYSSFTALMAKYRNISDNNSVSSSNLPSTSKSLLSLPDTPVSVSETMLDGGEISNLSSTDFPSASSSATLLPNTAVGLSETVSYGDESLSSAKTDLPSTSDPTTLLLNTPVGVSERVSYDDTSLSPCTDSNTQETNSCPEIPPIVDHQSTDTSLGNKRVCFFCKKDRKQFKGKQQSLHSFNDVKMYDKITEWVTKFQNQELLRKINDLRTSNSPIFYHHSCELGYLNDYKRMIADTARTSWHSVRDIHKNIFDKIVSIIEKDIVKKKNYLLLASLCDTYNNELQQELILQPDADVNLMTNHHLEEKIVKQFKQIKIVTKKKKNYNA